MNEPSVHVLCYNMGNEIFLDLGQSGCASRLSPFEMTWSAYVVSMEIIALIRIVQKSISGFGFILIFLMELVINIASFLTYFLDQSFPLVDIGLFAASTNNVLTCWLYLDLDRCIKMNDQLNSENEANLFFKNYHGCSYFDLYSSASYGYLLSENKGFAYLLTKIWNQRLSLATLSIWRQNQKHSLSSILMPYVLSLSCSSPSVSLFSLFISHWGNLRL